MFKRFCTSAVIVGAILLVLSFVSIAADAQSVGGQSAAIQTPILTPNGTIVLGSKSIWRKASWSNIMMCIDSDAICSMFEIFNLGRGDINPVFFMNIEQGPTENGSFFSADIRDWMDNDVKLGTYRLSLGLLEDGLIKVESVAVLDDVKVLKSRYSKFEFPPYIILSGEYTKGGESISFDGNNTITLIGEQLEDATISFFPDSSGKSFKIIPQSCSKFVISPNAITFYANKDGVMSFLLDIRDSQIAGGSSELSPNGIDFWEIDRLHLPDYGASRNFVMNPSFEAGLRYWGYPCFAEGLIPVKYQDFYRLDDKQAHSGSHSLRIKALPIRCPLPLGPFALPFISGKNYTLSFYAKGSIEKNLMVSLWGRQLRHGGLFDKSVTTFAIDNEWKRYTTPLVPTDRFGGVYLKAQLTGAVSDDAEETVWIDDVQIEEGELTDFTQAPVAAQMVSTARGNFLEFGDKPDFELHIQSQPNSEGSVSLAVEDFFFNKIFEDTYQFKTDDTGKSVVVLDKLSTKVTNEKLRGVYAVNSVFTVDGIERPYKDYFRFSVMDFLDNTHKNKNIFNLHYVYSLQAGGPDMERFVQREQQIGFGSITYDFGSFANDLDYDLDKERMDILEKYGIECVGRPVLKLHNGINGEISEQDGSIKMYNIKSRIDPTDEELAVFESICAVKAKSRPWNKIWWFTGESNPGVMPLEGYPDAFAKFLLATLRGIKKGNPDAQVLIEGGPWSLDPEAGTKWVERYIQDTKRLDPTARFDGAACHHYRNFPENPDLDSDIAAFLAMLDRNDCGDWPFHINEGGNYCPYSIPEEGVSPYIVHSANPWYFGPLSYHTGRAERIAAAFTARNWLVALKYQDRVASMEDFMSPSRYLDFDFSPRIYDKIPNTLGRLLGDASFYKDIRFAPFVRCYVFKEDKTKAPIAAIWGHKESVDRWKEDSPAYTFDFGGQDITFIDLMENQTRFLIDADGRTVIPMSPFPLFIKGAVGSEDAICKAISEGKALTDTATFDVVAFPNCSGQAEIIIKNLISKQLDGEAQIVLNTAQSNIPITIAPMSESVQGLPLPQAAVNLGIPLDFDFSCSVNAMKPKEISGRYMLLKNNSHPNLNAASSASDWRKLPAIELGDGISLRMAVANKMILAAVEIKNTNVSPADVFAGAGLYIDPFGKTDQWDIPKITKEDLAVFEFIKSGQTSLAAHCHYVQGTQAGSGSGYLVSGGIQKRIAVETSAIDGGAFMVIAVPEVVVSPLILEAGSRFGINVCVPSIDKQMKMLAPIENFKKVGDPGQLIDFVTVIVCD